MVRSILDVKDLSYILFRSEGVREGGQRRGGEEEVAGSDSAPKQMTDLREDVNFQHLCKSSLLSKGI